MRCDAPVFNLFIYFYYVVSGHAGVITPGIRILSAEITDVDEAAALNYHYQENHIYSCSWGPPDDGRSVDAPLGVILKALINGIENGRNGSGNIFVFASGNGGANDDNCNYDGYTNSIYTITIGAIDRLGNHPPYSEQCAAQLAVTYSSGSGGHIVGVALFLFVYGREALVCPI
jgi:Subtilase family